MLLYTIELEGDFMTFNGIDDTVEEGRKYSHRKQSVKRIQTEATNNILLLINVDDDTTEYDYTEVTDPGTGLAFVDLETFRVYMVTNLTV